MLLWWLGALNEVYASFLSLSIEWQYLDVSDAVEGIRRAGSSHCECALRVCTASVGVHRHHVRQGVGVQTPCVSECVRVCPSALWLGLTEV